MIQNKIVRTAMGIWALEYDTHLSKWVKERGLLNVMVNEIAQHAPYIPENGVVIDAGACIGDSTITYAQLVGPRGKVFAFEPHPLIYQALVKNMAIFNNVITIPKGLGSAEKDSKIKLLTNMGASSVSKEGDNISIIPLDNMVFDRLDFIHLDTEGYEVEILLGAQKTIRKHKPVMALECCWEHMGRHNTNENILRETLNGLGYNMVELSLSPYMPERNVMAIPK